MVYIPPRCVLNHSKSTFALEERKCKVVVNNERRYNVAEYKVDNCIFDSGDGTRCDFLVNVQETNSSIFIELKGSDLDKALKQLIASHTDLQHIRKREVYWIICYSGSPNTNSSTQNLKLKARKKEVTLLIGRTTFNHSL